MKLNRIFSAMTALSGVLALGLAGMGSPALAASATGNASATIVTPIGITAGTALNFGTIDPGAGAGGTVTVFADGTATAYSGVAAVTGGTVSAGTFNVTGSGTLAYNVTLPAAAVTLNGSGGGTMTVDTFNSYTANTASTAGTGALSAGADTLSVGAVLHVGGSQTAGTYTGTYSVSVVYQ
jgi:hypothetical protein